MIQITEAELNNYGNMIAKLQKEKVLLSESIINLSIKLQDALTDVHFHISNNKLMKKWEASIKTLAKAKATE